ncbi:MAG TPA: hypothetical protein VMR97_07885 [Acidimicrobiales bacterium]|nr:hypothetical protein [Acidimicrobiales bacterium]
MALQHELSFWAGVGLVAVFAVLFFKVVMARVPFTPLQQIAAAL